MREREAMRIPTESRIFADRYLRELRRLETLHANRNSPGTSTWGAAFGSLFERMDERHSPRALAATVETLTTYLKSVPKEERNVRVVGASSASRSAWLCVLASCAATHPVLGIEEEGANVVAHLLTCSRKGDVSLTSAVITYASKHCLSRLHQREQVSSHEEMQDILDEVGMLGFLLRWGAWRDEGSVSLRVGELLVVGTLMLGRDPEGKCAPFVDIRSAIPISETTYPELLAQGEAFRRAVLAWLADPLDFGGPARMAAEVPLLPVRDNYVISTIREPTQ
jgi:hypothetical protein